MNQPSRPGIYFVTGQRLTASRRNVVSYDGTLCEVRLIKAMGKTGLGVVFMGSDSIYPLEAFEANFRPLRVEVQA